jgi:hypothetical protein
MRERPGAGGSADGAAVAAAVGVPKESWVVRLHTGATCDEDAMTKWMNEISICSSTDRIATVL